MPQLRKTSWASLALVLLGFTCAKTARADAPKSSPPKDAAPGKARGAVVRAGSVVGVAHFAGHPVSVLGARVIAGHAVGPLILTVSYALCQMSEAGPIDNDHLGTFQRLGAGAHLDLASHRLGDISSVRVWTEGGIGRQRARWREGDPARRTDVMAGMGLTFAFASTDPHRGLPSVWGWNFGWRLMFAGGEDGMPIARVSCRGNPSCGAMQPQRADLTMVVGSEFVMSW